MINNENALNQKLRNENAYKIGLLCGLIPLAGGLFIFFTWWAARAFFAIDLSNFETYGFLWIMISIPVAVAGLLLMTFFLIRNFPNLIKRCFYGFLLILINIPIAYLVMLKQAELGERAYVKIYNGTKQDKVEFALKSSDLEIDLGQLSDNESLVESYIPKYIDQRGSSSYPTIDTVMLVVKAKFTIYYLKLPRIDKGECVELYIDKEFKLNTCLEKK